MGNKGKPVGESNIAKRDLDRLIYRETHVSKRAKRFITVSGRFPETSKTAGAAGAAETKGYRGR